MLSWGKGAFVPSVENTSLCSVFQIKGFLHPGGDLCQGAGTRQPLGSVNGGDSSIPASPRGFGRTVVAVGGDEIYG